MCHMTWMREIEFMFRGGDFVNENDIKKDGRNNNNRNTSSVSNTIANAYFALNRFADKIADEIVDSMEEKLYEEVFTFDSCVSFCKEYMQKNSMIVGFVLSVKKANMVKNTKIKYIITQGLVDKNDRPVTVDGNNPISRRVYAGDVDEKTINYLNGDETRIFTLK